MLDLLASRTLSTKRSQAKKNRKFSAYKVSENRVLFSNGNQQMSLGDCPFLPEQNLP